VGGSGINWAICKSAPRSRQITTPAPHHSSFFTGRMPFLLPNQQRQSTEGKYIRGDKIGQQQLTAIVCLNCAEGERLYSPRCEFTAGDLISDDSDAYLTSSAFTPSVSMDLIIVYIVSSHDIAVDVLIVSQSTEQVTLRHFTCGTLFKLLVVLCNKCANWVHCTRILAGTNCKVN